MYTYTHTYTHTYTYIHIYYPTRWKWRLASHHQPSRQSSGWALHLSRCGGTGKFEPKQELWMRLDGLITSHRKTCADCFTCFTVPIVNLNICWNERATAEKINITSKTWDLHQPKNGGDNDQSSVQAVDTMGNLWPHQTRWGINLTMAQKHLDGIDRLDHINYIISINNILLRCVWYT